jgi:hypothetical protein
MSRVEHESFREKAGGYMEIGGIVGGALGLLTGGQYLLAAGIASFLGGAYLRSH